MHERTQNRLKRNPHGKGEIFVNHVSDKGLICRGYNELLQLNDLKKPDEKMGKRRELQDGGRVRRGDHLPPHKYIRNTSTHGTAPTEHLLNAGRRPQTSQKARNSPCTWVGQKKKEKTETKE